MLLSACVAGGSPSVKASDANALQTLVTRGDISLVSYPGDTFKVGETTTSNGWLAKGLGVQSVGSRASIPVVHKFRVKDSPEKSALKAAGIPIFVFARPQVEFKYTLNGVLKTTTNPVGDIGDKVESTCLLMSRDGIMFRLAPENDYSLDMSATEMVNAVIRSQSGSVEKAVALNPMAGQILGVYPRPTKPVRATCYHSSIRHLKP